MEDPFVELVTLARRALTAPRKIKPAAVHLLEAHPRCVPELANLVRAGNFTETSRWLQARRPAHVDRAVVLQIERALNDRLRGDRPRRSRPADAPAPPRGGRAAAGPAVRSRIPVPVAAVPREAGRTVVAVGGMVDALVPFHRDVDDVQRWVAPPGRLTLVRPLPDLVRGTDETQQWRQEVRDGAWVCPWPACPHPELVLRVGDVRVPHVAHVSIRGHGADADWVAFTLAALERMIGQPVRVLGDEPLTVLAGTTPFVLVSSTWSARIAGAVRAAAVRAGRPPVLVVRASRLPARVLPVAVHNEQRPRWGLRASPELVAGLTGAAHVLAAPDPPRDDVNVPSRTDVPVWGARWLGISVEGAGGRLDWRHLSPTPVVAIDLDDARATRALRAIASPTVVRYAATLGAADTSAPAPPGQGVDGVLVGEAGPRVYCHWCRTEQTVADGLDDAAFSQLTDELDDDEAYELLERQTIGFCIYEACPRCGGPIHTT